MKSGEIKEKRSPHNRCNSDDRFLKYYTEKREENDKKEGKDRKRLGKILKKIDRSKFYEYLQIFLASLQMHL